MKKLLLLLCFSFFISMASCNNGNSDNTNFDINSNNESVIINSEDPGSINIENLSLEEKVFGLSLIWKEAEYNFVFWSKHQDLNWEKAYNESLLKVINSKDMREYYLELSKFISLLQDGHTNVWFPDEIYKQYGALPLSVRYIDGKYFIINTDDTLKSELYNEILQINGLPTQQYIEEKIFPYMWHEKMDSACYLVFQLMPIIEEGNEIELETINGSFTVKPSTEGINWIKNYTFTKNDNLSQIFKSDTLEISITTDNIAVIVIPTFNDGSLTSQFYSILPQIKDCDGFIIDVRGNGGGNSSNADAVAQAFINGRFENSRSKMPIHNGTYKAWGRTYRSLEDETTTTRIPQCSVYIESPVVILENFGTASSAEDLLVVFDNINRATIVGVPSYGSTGQPLYGDLPGGGGFRICTRWCLYPNGKEFINIGIQPHVYANLSIDDFKNEYDSIFEKGIAVLREQIGN